MADPSEPVESPSSTQLDLFKKGRRNKPGRPPKRAVRLPKVPHPPGTPVDSLGRSLVKKRTRMAEHESRKPPAMVTIRLQMRHSFNGKFYGPGTVTVSKTKAETFMNTEYAAAEKEMSLQRQEAFIIGYGPQGLIKRQVPWAQFDTILSREELPLQNLPSGG